MPYAPGVQDISGQLLAQGMQARAQGIAGGVQTLFQGLQQNQMMTGQALARFQAATAANPKLLDFLNKAGAEESPIPVNPEILKAYADIKSGKTNVQNTALLAQFADSYNHASMQEDANKLRQAQMAQMAQEDLYRKAQITELGSRQRAQELQNIGFEQGLRMRGINLPQSQGAQTTQAPMAAPSGAPAAPAPRSSYEMYERSGQPKISDEERAYLLTQNISDADRAYLQGQQPTTPAENAAKFATPPAAAGQQFRTPTGLDPKLWQDAVAETLMNFGSGKGMADPMIAYNRMQTAQKTARVEDIASKEQMTFDDANAKSKRLNAEDPDYIHSPKVNPNGTYGIEKTPRPKSSEALGREAAMTKLSEERAKDAVVQLGRYRTAGAAARDNLSRYDRMEAALNAGVATGFGAETMNMLSSLAVSAGLYPEGKQAEKEVLFKDLAVDAFEKARLYLEGQGSVSQPERDAIKQLSMSAQTNPKALLQLIAINRQLALRQIAADDHRMALEDQYKDDPLREIGINSQMQRWFAANPLGKFETAARMPSAQRSTADDVFNEVMSTLKK